MAHADIERRLIESSTTIERCACDKTGKKSTTIRGYAALYNSDSVDLGGFVERILPGAFEGVMKRGTDVVALYNHDSSFLLGRESSGTLRLFADERGLRYEIDAPESRADVVEAIERGDVRGSSFAFRLKPAHESWSRRADGMQIREIKDFDGLFDVGPVMKPAYPSTESFVSRRALEHAQQERAQDVFDPIVQKDTAKGIDTLPGDTQDPAESSMDASSIDEEDELTVANYALHEAIETIAAEQGKWPQSGPAGAHYMAASPFASSGIRCENCVFWNQAGNCEVVEGSIAAGGVCKLWIIPEKSIVETQAPSPQRSKIDSVAKATAKALEIASRAFNR